jgi:hypothetical protein
MMKLETLTQLTIVGAEFFVLIETKSVPFRGLIKTRRVRM